MTRLDRAQPQATKFSPEKGGNSRRNWKFAAGALLLSQLTLGLNAFVYLTDPPTVWIDETIPISLQLGPPLSSPLTDGSTSYNAVAGSALALWNQHLTTAKFTSISLSQGTAQDGDGVNQVFFDSTIYGETFGEGVLAVATRWSVGTTRLESDIIFNSAEQWDSYRGPLRFPDNGIATYDFLRVALHEFGHSLGLGHPDEVGQRVLSVMNSFVTDLDHLSADDALGASSLYGGAPAIVTHPRSQTVTAGAKAEFSVVARGIAPLRYQWLFGGESIGGATNATYTIDRAQSIHAGTYSVLVSNSEGSVQSASATLAIDQGTAFGIVGVPFIYQIVANNSPTWYTASGLPPGLICRGSTGVISGTPTKVGTYSVDVTARNLFTTVSATISFTIDEGIITSPTGVAAVIGVPLFYPISSDNDATWYSVSSLPPGLILDGRTGVITGTPNRIGIFSFEVTARNLFASISTNVFFAIHEGEITSASSAEGIVGVPFRYQISSDNNATWYTASGLPPGLFCRGSTGLISGTPTEAGVFSVDVTARSLFASTSATISISITDGTINPGAPPKIDLVRSSGRFVLTWPKLSDVFVLEEAHLQPKRWTNSTAKVLVQGDQKLVILPTNGPATFYRLRSRTLYDAQVKSEN